MKETIHCLECDKKIERYKSEKAKYCSRTCQYGSLEENYNILKRRKPEYVPGENHFKFLD